MKTSRRNLFGLLAVSPVAVAEMTKAFKEAPEPPKLKAEAQPSTSGSMFVSYGGGFYTGRSG